MSKADGGERQSVAYAVAGEAFAAQAALTIAWLAGLAEDDFTRPSSLQGWDVRTLVGHLLLTTNGLTDRLKEPIAGTPLAIEQYVKAYTSGRADIDQRTRDVVGSRSPRQLIDALADAADPRPALDKVAPSAVILGGRGPIRALDWLTTRLVELVVHSDDLSRSLPNINPVPLHRPALAGVTRTLAELLASVAPGRSVEVRVPPFVAVQAVSGPRHTRGTPANVVELSPLVWLRLATGRFRWSEAEQTGFIHASGARASLEMYLPLLS